MPHIACPTCRRMVRSTGHRGQAGCPRCGTLMPARGDAVDANQWLAGGIRARLRAVRALPAPPGAPQLGRDPAARPQGP